MLLSIPSRKGGDFRLGDFVITFKINFKLISIAISFTLIVALTNYKDSDDKHSKELSQLDVVRKIDESDTQLAPEIPAYQQPSSTSDDLPLASQRVYLAYPELIQISQIENEVGMPAEAISRLQPMLIASDPVIRLAALESIASLTHPESLSALIDALHDPEPMIRITAIEGLVMQKNESVDLYIEPLLFDADKGVIIVAIDAMAELESELAVHALASLLSDQDPVIRYSAVNALSEIDSELAREYISLF